ncbi:MAG: NAD-glutamate dehydrogenase domain-containing protein, partial [Pseudomonadota bacterium]
MNFTAAPDETLKSDLIDQVVGIAQDRLKKDGGTAIGADEAEAFIRQFYAFVPPGDIQNRDPAELYGAAVAFWKFGRRRPSAGPKIRVYNPRFEEHGWQSVHTVVEIINDDMPFLVDSVTSELNRQGFTVHLVIHPIVYLKRGKDGQMAGFAKNGKPQKGLVAESFMHIEIDEQTAKSTLREIAAGVESVLADVRAAVEDWRRMRTKALDVVGALAKSAPKLPDEDIKEGLEFLKWLAEDHFTFLGYREYKVVERKGDAHMTVIEGSGLGILRDPEIHVFEGVRDLGKLPEEVRNFLQQPRLLIINKANMRSTVHRAVHLDAVGVKLFDKSGAVAGERLFVGLFTSSVYSRSPRFIPLLRLKLERTLKRAQLARNSHAAKALSHILETFPRDELFQITDDDLFRIGRGILHLQERQRVALFVRHDAFQRFVSCLVYAPRERYDTDMRKRFEVILSKAFNGPIAAFYTQIADDSVLARVHFIVKTTPGEVPPYETSEIEARLVEAGRGWSENLRDDLIDHKGEETGLKLLRRYGDAFPTSYREATDRRNVLIDIDKIEGVLGTGTLGLNMYKSLESEDHEIRFKIYNRGGPVPLSDVLPMLENMGLRVVDEAPQDVRPAGTDPVWIHDFGMARRDGGPVDVGEVRELFHDSFARVWNGEIENDGFNGLTVDAALTWREIVVLRAYAKYLRQTGVPFSRTYLEETLTGNAELTALIVELFKGRFDPETAKAADKAVEDVRARLEARLEGVANLDQDRIIRHFVNLVMSTLRTNFYQTTGDGGPKPYLSFKFDSKKIEELPLPRPIVEIWVYSPRVEGVHLRFGKVARGGLRWSDRREDFRTEVLGLVKAQTVKNAVIVPVGSKGGFVVKRLPSDGGRAALQAEGIECYKTFIRGMLDLTENLQGADVIPPPDVVRYDDDDPYLVVAADKGTASFSDIANEVSAEYGFWLGDAFASGGSAGYDHKVMGITARGAWEAVKRHFREMNKDIQNEDFTVIGIGDMGGDVFGNGMLLSPHIKLIGAFNHMHIFVDPDPNPKKSVAERKRLFDTPGTSWADYAAALISKGGGVFERNSARVHGSAFFSYNLEGSGARFERCTFTDNVMESGTGSVYHQGVPLTLVGSTFSGNT